MPHRSIKYGPAATGYSIRLLDNQPYTLTHTHSVVKVTRTFVGGNSVPFACGRNANQLCNCSFSLRFPQASSEIYFVLPFCCGPVAVEWILLFAHTTK